MCSQFRTSRVTTTSRRGESRRVAMASNSLFSSVTPCQQNFFWGECCEKLFSFHCGSASGHTGVKLHERVDNQWRTRTHDASGTLKVAVFTFALHAKLLTCLCNLKTLMWDDETQEREKPFWMYKHSLCFNLQRYIRTRCGKLQLKNGMAGYYV